jgi:hypothetical protein
MVAMLLAGCNDEVRLPGSFMEVVGVVACGVPIKKDLPRERP